MQRTIGFVLETPISPLISLAFSPSWSLTLRPSGLMLTGETCYPAGSQVTTWNACGRHVHHGRQILCYVTSLLEDSQLCYEI